MDNNDSHNESEAVEFVKTCDDEHVDAEFGPLNFPEQNKVRDVSVDLYDSWLLDDLYCDGLSHNAEDESRNVVLEDEHAVLSWAAHKLSTSPSARSMLLEAEESGWAISIQSLEGPDFHLDVQEKTITLDDQGLKISALGRSEYFKNAILVSFIRALRDVWQEKRHGAFDLNYGPESVLMLERTRTADLDVMSVLVGWELRGEGQGSLWRHLIGSEEGDLAMRFSGFLERDPSSLFNGKALAVTFKQWFCDHERVRKADHETLNYMDSLVQECESDQAFGSKPLKAVGLEVLSCLPDKTAYLQGDGSEILRDPVYAGLNDSINQSHFMQVLYDLKVTRVQDVPFRDATLAEKIFPNGCFTSEPEKFTS